MLIRVYSQVLPETESFAMNIFRGKLNVKEIMPFPKVLSEDRIDDVQQLVSIFEKFASTEIKPNIYDEAEEFSESLITLLAENGAYGLSVPEELGGSGLVNTEYARLVNIIGMHDLAVGTHLGAHQSIGYKGILMFGTEKQKNKYLPDLASGRKIASYCLTESGSGSDVSSIQTSATLSPDGKHYILNGTKIWITNGGIADVFTVFAKTPVKDADGSVKNKITAFIVERGFGGLTNGPPEKKMGIKASNTVAIYLDNCKVPVENVLGEVGNGFKLAVRILNQGRFGMAAALSGTMRAAIRQAVDHAVHRKQFDRKLDGFENVQEKLTTMAMRQYVTESIAFMLSGSMDLGAKDFQVEAAMSKIYSSESAWYCVDEAIQILGGTGFMRHSNLERVLRDLRVFRIFEGANDVLRLFVSLTGLNYAGKHLKAASKSSTGLFGLAAVKAGRVIGLPGEGRSIKTHLPQTLAEQALLVGNAIDQFGGACTDLLSRYGKLVVEEQFRLSRLSDAAIQIYGMTCALSRVAKAIQEQSKTVDHEMQLVTLAVNEGCALVQRLLKELNPSESDHIFGLKRSIAKSVCGHGGVVCSTPLGF